MKLFDNQVSNVSATSSATSSEVKASPSSKARSLKRNKIKPEKESFSADEIRQKLAASVEMSNTAQNKSMTNSKKLGEGFLNEKILNTNNKLIKLEDKKEIAIEEKSDDPNTKDHIIKSDVGVNDPTDTTTTEKLKTVLSKGAFNFNSRERDVLDKLLSDR